MCMRWNWGEPRNVAMSVGPTELMSKQRSGRLFDEMIRLRVLPRHDHFCQFQALPTAGCSAAQVTQPLPVGPDTYTDQLGHPAAALRRRETPRYQRRTNIARGSPSSFLC